MASSVSIEEVARLARAMTLKNALYELPFGGAKAGIAADSHTITKEEKHAVIDAFAKAIKEICPKAYIAGPDMAMGQEEMRIIASVLGAKACTGKPKEMNGLPHELGSTGFGVYHAALVGIKSLKKDIENCTVAIEGFGNVGWFAAKFLSESRARIVAVSDSRGVVFNKAGLNFERLAKVKETLGSVIDYKEGTVLQSGKILDVEADILITAAVPDLIKPSLVPKLKYSLVVEGSNLPTIIETEELLHKQGILVIPDIVANAGGVISSFVEHIGGTEKEMFELVERKIKSTTQAVLDKARDSGVIPRVAANEAAMTKLGRCS
ncbi:Glu/Leu/Phe/Val dehydrogenase [archaeon]|nr:Glu/Leu/Phe/Val dehydrogenase [archaeon]